MRPKVLEEEKITLVSQKRSHLTICPRDERLRMEEVESDLLKMYLQFRTRKKVMSPVLRAHEARKRSARTRTRESCEKRFLRESSVERTLKHSA